MNSHKGVFCSHITSIDQDSHCGVKEDRSEDKYFVSDVVQSSDISAEAASSYQTDDRNTVQNDKPIQKTFEQDKLEEEYISPMLEWVLIKLCLNI